MITIVSGFFRCGSSLTMQMLDAAGLRCAGKYPAFEVEDPVGAVEENGRFDAVKWLDPEPPPPRGVFRAVWVDRDNAQQARSAVKFLAAAGQKADAREIARVCWLYRDRSVEVLRWLTEDRVLEADFEDIVADPLDHARKLAAFVGCGDPYTMAKVAVSRGPECLPYLLEADLVARRRR